MQIAIITMPYIGESYAVTPTCPTPGDRLEFAMCEARCQMFDNIFGGPDVDNMTRKTLGAREDLIEVWGDLITRTDGQGLSMDILL